jgi:uncharacterized Zn finger protein (UPF0148 family)
VRWPRAFSFPAAHLRGINMIAKAPCQQCGTNLEFEAEHYGQFIACPVCGQQTRLLLQKPDYQESSPKKSAAESPPQKISKNTAVKAHLEMIRDQSCYPQLRFIIEICFVLLLCGVSLYAIMATIGIMQNQSEFPILYVVSNIAAIIGSVVLLIALRQSALLLIDIADTLLNEHAENKRSIE